MKLLAAGQFVSEARRTLLCEAERQRLSLEGHTPRQPVKRRLTYEDASEGDGGGRVVRWCWVNFQCRGVLQF